MWIGNSCLFIAFVRFLFELSTSELPLKWMIVVLIGDCSSSADRTKEVKAKP